MFRAIRREDCRATIASVYSARTSDGPNDTARWKRPFYLPWRSLDRRQSREPLFFRCEVEEKSFSFVEVRGVWFEHDERAAKPRTGTRREKVTLTELAPECCCPIRMERNSGLYQCSRCDTHIPSIPTRGRPSSANTARTNYLLISAPETNCPRTNRASPWSWRQLRHAGHSRRVNNYSCC